jgi:hypothetical protein
VVRLPPIFVELHCSLFLFPGIVGAALFVVLVYVIYTRLYPSFAADSSDVAESPMVEMVPTPSLQGLEKSQQTVMHNRQW